MRRIAIHQPNFMPWLPFFQKIAAVDLFVILGNCQWWKGGYQNRFHFNDRWFTMSVFSGLNPIKQKRYKDPQGDWHAIKRSLPDFRHELSLFDGCIGESLHDTNVAIIRRFCRHMGIQTPILFDKPTKLTGTDRLVSICRNYGATHYLSGSSGRDYLEPEKFGDIAVEYQQIADENRVSLMEAMRRVFPSHSQQQP